MSVKAFPNKDQIPAGFKAKGISKTPPTAGSKTQKRKANKATHQKTNPKH